MTDIRKLVKEAKEKFPPDKPGQCYDCIEWLEQRIPLHRSYCDTISGGHGWGVLEDGRIIDIQLEQFFKMNGKFFFKEQQPLNKLISKGIYSNEVHAKLLEMALLNFEVLHKIEEATK